MYNVLMTYAEDLKGDKMIHEALNKRAIEEIEARIKLVCNLPLKEINPTDKKFCKAIKNCYFPKLYPVDKCGPDFIKLLNLLKNEEHYELSLPMRYALDKVLADARDSCIKKNNSTINLFENREEIIKYLKNEETIIEGLDADEDEFLRFYENYDNYRELYFDDIDFLLLDSMTMEDIKRSPLNEMMNVIPYNEEIESIGEPYEEER